MPLYFGQMLTAFKDSCIERLSNKFLVGLQW